MKNFCLVALVVVSVLAGGESLDAKQCPENEEYLECGPSCGPECATLGDICQIAYFRCPDGCYCIEGYARNSTGRCIPIEQCPPKQRRY